MLAVAARRNDAARRPRAGGAAHGRRPAGPIATSFITPMAAVAGSVADEMATIMRCAAPLRRAAHQQRRRYRHSSRRRRKVRSPAWWRARTCPRSPARSASPTAIGYAAWRRPAGGAGARACGIADAVTVLARDAAGADAAATMIANAVNADHPAVRRAPPGRSRTTATSAISMSRSTSGRCPRRSSRRRWPEAKREAQRFLGRGLIVGAVLMLEGQYRVVGIADAGCRRCRTCS